MKKQQFDISIDHELLKGAKAAFDTCMKAAIRKAISTGSNEGSATLRISFDIYDAADQDTGMIYKTPQIAYKAGYSVPMKESMDAKIIENSRLVVGDGEWQLVNGQISMDEIMETETPEGYGHLAEVR